MKPDGFTSSFIIHFFSTYPHSDKLLLITISQILRLLLHEQNDFFRYYNKIGFIFAVSNDCYLTLRKERLWKSLKI